MVRSTQRSSIRDGRDGSAEHPRRCLAKFRNAAAARSHMAASGSFSGKPDADALYGCCLASGDAKPGAPEGAGLVGRRDCVVFFIVAARDKRSGCSEFFSGPHPPRLPALLSAAVLHKVRSGLASKGPHGHAILVAPGVLLWHDGFRSNLPPICLESSSHPRYGSGPRRHLDCGARCGSSDAICAALPEFTSDCGLDGTPLHSHTGFAAIHFP